ncbi:MAG: tetratricopeptide repeat protein [Phycisphaerales bacterium]|nr:tetratricopeptide repeat protein [Phycisphaerales bacterium]
MLAIAAQSVEAAQESHGGDAALRQYNSAAGLLNRGLFEMAEGEYRQFLAAHGAHAKVELARYGLAVCLYRQQKYDDAMAELTTLAANPRFEFAAEVHAMLGRSHLARQRFAEAVAAFDALLRKHGKTELAADALAGKIEALHHMGQADETLREAQAFAKAWPDSPLRERTDYFLGLALTAKGDSAAAASHFEDYAARFSKSELAGQAVLLAAQCHDRAGNLEAAGPLYEKVLAGKTAALECEALLGLGRLLQQQGRPEDAAVMLDRLLKQPAPPAVTSAARFYRGLVWMDLHKFDRALEQLEQVSANDSEWADDAAYWSAKCRLRSGEFTDAAERLARAIEAFPKSSLLPEMSYDRAVALMQAQKREEAVPLLEKFRRNFPEHALAADALHLQAFVLHELGRYDESGKLCREFLKRHPKHESAAFVAFVACENEFLAGHMESAENGYRDFLKDFATHAQAPQARYRLGMTLYRLQKFEEAAPLLAQAASGTNGGKGFESALLVLGDMAMQRGEWKTAEQHYAEYLKQSADPQGTEDALLKLATARQRQGRHDEAARDYEELLHRFPKGRHRTTAQFERGQCLAALNRDVDAAKAFSDLVAENTDAALSAYALQHLGVLSSRRGEHVKAAELFREAAARATDPAVKAQVLYQQGQAWFSAGNYEEAEASLGQFLKTSGDHAQAPAAAANRAIALARLNRTQDALKAMDRAAQKYGSKLDASARQSLLYERAWCLRAEGQPEEAGKAYEQIMADPHASGSVLAHALLELAELEADAKHNDRAVELLRRLSAMVKSDETSVTDEVLEPAWYRLGVCEHQLEQYVESAETLSRLIERFPQSKLLPSTLYFCGDACFKSGKNEPAIQHLTRLVESAPADDAAPAGRLRLGEALAAVQRWAQSEQVFADYLDRAKAGPQRYQALFGLGWARENQGRHEEAIRAYQEVVATHDGPTSARAQFQIGECLFAQGKLDDAVREFLKVDILYAYPEWSAAALYEAGQCFEKLNKPQEARAQFKAVVEKFGDSQWAKLAAKRMAGDGEKMASGRDN